MEFQGTLDGVNGHEQLSRQDALLVQHSDSIDLIPTF